MEGWGVGKIWEKLRDRKSMIRIYILNVFNERKKKDSTSPQWEWLSSGMRARMAQEEGAFTVGEDAN